MKILIVGSGLSGAVLAALLSNSHDVTVMEQNDYIGGMCYDEIVSNENCEYHKHIFGPHIFHTDNREVIDFINVYGYWESYHHTVKTTYNGRIYSMPINLHTINQFFNTALSPKEAKIFITEKINDYISKTFSTGLDDNLESTVIHSIGKEMYDAFFKGYTKKQWNMDPKSISGDIAKRIPIRYNYDDNYFRHDFVALPKYGYVKFFENMLCKSEVILNRKFTKEDIENYDYVFYTGPIDEFYDNVYGKLSYRTCHFDFSEELSLVDGLGCAVMNYSDENIPYTRKADYFYLTPKSQRRGEKTTVVSETPKEYEEGEIPFYPTRTTKDIELYEKYYELSLNEKKVKFVGRLANYRYMDMDVVIANAISVYKKFESEI